MSQAAPRGARLVGATKFLLLPLFAALLVSCARFSFTSDKQFPPFSPFSLTLTLDQESYQPGEAVICEAALTNNAFTTQTAVMLNYASLTFSFMPSTRGGGRKSRIVTPVISEKESLFRADGITPWSENVGPGQTVTRSFVFTILTEQRGAFLLQAMYRQAAPGALNLTQQTPAQLKAWTVEGDRAVQRYVGGLLTKEEALRLAREKFTGEPDTAEAILIRDEMGFLKWWVNVDSIVGGEKALKSCFVDPYLARIWEEAKPFTAEHQASEETLPNKTTIIDKLRDKK